MRDCTVIAEKGAQIINRDDEGEGADRANQTSATSGDTRTEEGVVVYDFGLVMPEGAVYSRAEGTVAYAASTQTADYGATATFLAGEAVYDLGAPITLAPEALPVKEVALSAESASAGWLLARDGNIVTLSASEALAQAGPCTLTYTLAVAPETPIDLAVTMNLDPPEADADGWYTLDSERDYAWYLTSCPNNSKVRLGADITLLAKDYRAYTAQTDGTTLEFDGQGHAVTLPEGATMNGNSGRGPSDSGVEYCGVVAGQLEEGSIENVTVVIGGTVSGTSYVGGALGSSTWVNSGPSVNIANTHVRLLGTARISGTNSVGGFVGRAYRNPVNLTDCTLVAEAGAQIVNTGSNTALVVGCSDQSSSGASANVKALDMGVTMSGGGSGAVYTQSQRASGEAVYVASTVTPAYGEPAGTFLMGEQAGPGPWTLVPEGLTVQSVKTPTGWKASLDGNVLTLTGEPGQVELTYRLKGFTGVSIPLTLTVPAGTLTFVFPEGVAATDAQRAALADFAEGAGLSGEVAVSLGEGVSLDALGLFEGILSAKDGGVSVDYAFAVTAIAVEGDEVVVTVGLNDGATFAEGTRVSLVPTGGEGALGETASAPGAGNVTIRFPRTAGTTLFRARTKHVDSER